MTLSNTDAQTVQSSGGKVTDATEFSSKSERGSLTADLSTALPSGTPWSVAFSVQPDILVWPESPFFDRTPTNVIMI